MTLPFLERLADARVRDIDRHLAGRRARFTRIQSAFRHLCPTLPDSRPWAASNAYRITSVPSIFVVEPDGRIRSAVSGFNKAALEKLGERFGARFSATPTASPRYALAEARKTDSRAESCAV